MFFGSRTDEEHIVLSMSWETKRTSQDLLAKSRKGIAFFDLHRDKSQGKELLATTKTKDGLNKNSFPPKGNWRGLTDIDDNDATQPS